MNKGFIATLIVAIVIFGVISCTPTDNLLGNSPQRAPQNGDYSEYIISPEEAKALVSKEAEQWGLSSDVEYKSVETVIVGDILAEYYMLDNDTIKVLLEYGIMSFSDPAFYILNFTKGGYAMVLPNKKMGVGIVHVQNYDIEQSNTPSPNYPSIWNIPNIPNIDTISWTPPSKFIRDKWVRWVLSGRSKDKPKVSEYELTVNPDFQNGGSGGSTCEEFSTWVPKDSFELATTFYPKAEDFNMQDIDSLDRCWQVMFSFLGFWENPSMIFEQTGDWVTIKNDINTDPAPYWAKNMDKYFKIPWINHSYAESFYRMLVFLRDECNGAYPNVSLERYIYKERTKYSDISFMLRWGKPVIVLIDGEPFLAVKGVIHERDVTTYTKGTESGKYKEYMCKITFARGGDKKTVVDIVLNKSMYYIKY